MDLAKYRTIFIEESAEHFAEMSGALMELEKDAASAEAIDVVFRMAHSIKGMAASLGYDSISDTAHLLEDRMQTIRDAGRVGKGEELSLLFRGLTALEAMVEGVKETGEAPPADPDLLVALAAAVGGAEADPREEIEAAAEPAPESGADGKKKKRGVGRHQPG